MRRLRRAWRRLLGTLPSERREAELAAEIEAHLEMQAEDNRSLGMSPEQARRAARLKFGSIEAAKESWRDQRGLPQLETLLQDARYAARTLRRSPGFSFVAVLSLALGIGATCAIFSVVHSVLLRMPPYRDPGRLATISLGGAISVPIAEAFTHEARSLERTALFVNWSFNLAAGGEPERIPAARVSAALFDLLGVQPRLGRAFSPEEDRPGRENVVLIGDALWKRRFAADRRIVGRTVRLNGAPHTIVGVMPPGFQFPDGPELPTWAGSLPPAQMWRPLALAGWERTDIGSFNFAMIARLRPGVSPARVRDELFPILVRTAGKSNRRDDLSVRTLRDTLTAQVRMPLAILFGAVAVTLLIACVNLANLLVARGLRRRAEIAVRLSLGAARGRIVRQFLTEALVLALYAAMVALPLAAAGTRVLAALAPASLPIGAVSFDARVLAFAIVLALLTAVLSGAGPALTAARQAPNDLLKSEGRTATAAPSLVRHGLIVAEFALSLVLLVAASLLVRSFVWVARTPLGFRAENVLTLRMTLPEGKYDGRRRPALVEQLAADCAALPGVVSAAAVNTLPLTGESEGHGLIAVDSPDPNAYTMARVRSITPAYFGTLGMRLLAGREFTSRDRGIEPVAILSQTAARRLWPGVPDPAGRKVNENGRILTVAGIVEDTRASGLDTEIRPYIYVPFRQFPADDFALAVRSASDPAALAAAVKALFWRIDKDQPVTHVATMRELVADSVAPRRFQALLMALFAGFALLVAALGIYGVISYSVARRTHEIGIRMALGASRAAVMSAVLKQAGALALAGAVLGLAASFAVAPLLRTVLYHVSPADPLVFAIAALVLLAIAAAAALLPARRAARLDPTLCLRCD